MIRFTTHGQSITTAAPRKHRNTVGPGIGRHQAKRGGADAPLVCRCGRFATELHEGVMMCPFCKEASHRLERAIARAAWRTGFLINPYRAERWTI